MRRVEIYPVPVRGPRNFVWRWRTEGAPHKSSRSFAFYFDCVENARQNGYVVHLERPPGSAVPAVGVNFNLK